MVTLFQAMCTLSGGSTPAREGELPKVLFEVRGGLYDIGPCAANGRSLWCVGGRSGPIRKEGGLMTGRPDTLGLGGSRDGGRGGAIGWVLMRV